METIPNVIFRHTFSKVNIVYLILCVSLQMIRIKFLDGH